MRPKVRCPYHADKTASLVRYDGGWYCFGACARVYKHEDVEKKLGVKIDYEEETGEAEDLEETYRYIDSLPRSKIRGLEFPTDERGYFICWPSREYYKYRRHNPGNGPKYTSPYGHSPPIFWARRTQAATLYLVEGEINALSLARACPSGDVCSLGSASNFNSGNLTKYLTVFKNYSNMIVILDNDNAGIKALIETKAAFLYKIPYVKYYQFVKDCNDILCDEGDHGLQRRLQG